MAIIKIGSVMCGEISDSDLIEEIRAQVDAFLCVHEIPAQVDAFLCPTLNLQCVAVAARLLTEVIIDHSKSIAAETL